MWAKNRFVTGSLEEHDLRKNDLFLSFPYVCPEPVLVKCSFLYINGSKMPFFRRKPPAVFSSFLIVIVPRLSWQNDRCPYR
jgi:hypothetical protein